MKEIDGGGVIEGIERWRETEKERGKQRKG